MNNTQHTFTLQPMTAAVRAAVLSLSVMATAASAEDALVTQTQPVSVVEIGAGNTSGASAKAHEFDGLKHKGGFLIGNFDLRGGGSYDSNDTNRWRVYGFDLGTDARTLGFESSKQGTGHFSVVYDELQRNKSDSYQTPLVGAGTSVLTLPTNWVVPVVPRVNTTAANARGLLGDVTNSSALVAGVLTAPTAAMLTQAAAMQAADLPAFQHVNLGTKRTKIDFNALVNIGTRWDVSANFRHEDRTGLKALGTVTRFTGGDIATIIPDLIDQNHDQITLGLNYTGDQLVVQTHYFLSALTNNVASMTWGNWATPGASNNLQTMSSAPGNEVHQLGLNASYRFSSSTRLAGSLTYGRGTQNAAFLTDASTPLVPQASLRGLVVTKAGSLKLTSRPINGLNLSAGYRYDERDNRTPVNTYGYYDAGELKTGTSLFTAVYPTLGLGGNTNLNASRSYSRKLNNLSLDADYKVFDGHTLRVGYEQEKIDRWCNGSWIACVDANKVDEKTARADYQFTLAESLSGRLGLTHAGRTVDYNENAFLALVPMANVSPTGAPGGATAYGTMTAMGVTGYGPVSGLNPLPTAGSTAAFFFANNNALANSLYANQNRISELPGMRRYNMADRTREKVRSSVNWQANDALTLQASVDLNRDRYSKSVYGLQHARGWSVTLDGSYAVSENLSLAAFATQEDQRARSAGNSYTANSTAVNVNGFTAISGGCYSTIALRNASNKIDPCLNWTTENHDVVNTLGLALTQKNLLGGKLDANAGLSLSDAKTGNTVAGGNYANNPLAVTGAAAGTVAAYYIAATPFADITTRTTELRAGLKYRIDDSRSLRAGYLYQHMKSSDWAYDGMQLGGLAGVLPTLEAAPSFTVHTVSVAYIFSFR
jgi:MtrB/PioB family decaheme-associated outer membrane protein